MSTANLDLVNNAADVIVKYGFLGVGLALALLIAPAAYKFWNSKNTALATFTCGLAFIVTWGVLDIVQKNFPWLISSNRVLLSGVVLDVPNGFQVQVTSDLRKVGAAYLKRQINQENIERFDFPFILLSSDPPNCLSVAISNNDPGSESGSSGFAIAPISADDLKSNIALVVRAERANKHFQLRVWRENGDKQLGDASILEPLTDDIMGCSIGKTKASEGWFVSTARAQSGGTAKVQDLPSRLKSDDLFARRSARIDLSKQAPQSIELTKQLLNSNDYRLQLGALVALSIMPEADRKKLPPDVLSKVREFKTNSDQTIRDTAARIEVAR